MADTAAKRDIRRERIRVALETAVDKEQIGLAELAKVWGVGKPAFVNTRDLIPDFPPATVNGREYLYPRRKALLALDRWERRADAANERKANRLAALVGVDPLELHLSLSDLQKANQLQMDLEARALAQRMLIPRAQVQATASRVFQLLSRTLNELSMVVDPNGQYPPAFREAADKAGQDLLLRIHAEMKDMLADNADGPIRSDGDGGAARRARDDGARRKRPGRMG